MEGNKPRPTPTTTIKYVICSSIQALNMKSN